MTELEKQIAALVRPFIAQLLAAFAQNARAAFARALLASTDGANADASPSQTRVGRKRRRRVAKPVAPAVAARPNRKGTASPKPQPPSVTPRNLPDYLAANPGQRMDQLSKSLGIPVPKLQRAMMSLLESGVVRREGQRRGVKYYVVASA